MIISRVKARYIENIKTLLGVIPRISNSTNKQRQKYIFGVFAVPVPVEQELLLLLIILFKKRKPIIKLM